MATTFSGDISVDPDQLQSCSTDQSIFTVCPSAIYYPKSTDDVVALVELCKQSREQGVNASLTVRAGGTCMSGGSLSASWIVDMTRYMNTVVIDPVARTATVAMGAYFRDIEDEAKKHGLMFAPYPSSHRICGIGGMIGNNASGEKSLRHGPTSANVLSLEVVLADGTVYHAAQKSVADVQDAREQELLRLCDIFGDRLRAAYGDVTKCSSGYKLCDLVEGDVFSSVPVFVGAQGTLGIVTTATLRLVPIPKHLELILVSAHAFADIAPIIALATQFNPEGLETFDIHTYRQAQKHLSEFTEPLAPYVQDGAQLFILVQLSEDTADATSQQAMACLEALKRDGYAAVRILDESHKEAAWEVRRHSFTLMRDFNEDGFRAVPCIEDVIVPIAHIGDFVERVDRILKQHSLFYGYHGHIGDGSLRIIPVFDFKSPDVAHKITALMKDVFAVIKELHGNMSADHSDGMIRSPFLKEFYGEELYGVFQAVKELYDPRHIMNPNKKVGDIKALVDCVECVV